MPHPILDVPDLPSWSGLLSDARTGVLGAVQPGPHGYSGIGVARFRARLPLPGGSHTVCGAALDDPALAALRCVAEGAERYAAATATLPVRVARAEHLAEYLDEHPDEAAICLPADLGAATHPDELSWTAGVLLAGAGENTVWVPTAAATLPGIDEAGSAAWYPQGSTGLGAGRDRDDAVRAAAYEVIERHHLASAWEHRTSLVELSPPGGWVSRLRAEQLTAQVYAVPGEVDAAVLLAVLTDPARGLLGAGSACRHDPSSAATKAFEEAAVALAQAAELDDAATVTELRDGYPALRPHRPDRRYLDDYRTDDRDYAGATELATHLQLYLDPRVQAELRSWLARATPGSWARLPRCTDPPAALASAGLRPVGIELPTTELDRVGLHVWRVLAPGARTPVPAAVTGTAPPPVV